MISMLTIRPSDDRLAEVTIYDYPTAAPTPGSSVEVYDRHGWRRFTITGQPEFHVGTDAEDGSTSVMVAVEGVERTETRRGGS